jgi:hypothetical protein
MVTNVINDKQATPTLSTPPIKNQRSVSGNLQLLGSQEPARERGEDVALLMSGGIGDYLHYIARFDFLLQSSWLGPTRIAVFAKPVLTSFHSSRQRSRKSPSDTRRGRFNGQGRIRSWMCCRPMTG